MLKIFSKIIFNLMQRSLKNRCLSKWDYNQSETLPPQLNYHRRFDRALSETWQKRSKPTLSALRTENARCVYAVRETEGRSWGSIDEWLREDFQQDWRLQRWRFFWRMDSTDHGEWMLESPSIQEKSLHRNRRNRLGRTCTWTGRIERINASSSSNGSRPSTGISNGFQLVCHRRIRTPRNCRHVGDWWKHQPIAIE